MYLSGRHWDTVYTIECMCTVISAEPGGALAYAEQETDVDVCRNQDCYWDTVYTIECMFAVISAEPGGALTYTEQETDVDVCRNQDCNPAQLQDGWGSLGAGSAGEIIIIAAVILYYDCY